ncbi:MAG TPA: hypothetical protein PLZ69_02805 [Candidatus Pacearchaeota archaeon]|nr:hypothetical protein [Candidatus Pacearchaeota archaeon]
MASKDYLVDLNCKLIKLPSSRWYETPDGNFASVTTKLGVYSKPGLETWKIELAKKGVDPKDVSTKNMDEGSAVHKLTELYDMGEEVSFYDEEGNENYEFWGTWVPFIRYTNFVKELNAKPILIEQTVWSKEHGYAGTLDRISIIDNPKTGKRELALIDIKRAASAPPDYHWQLSAYKKAVEEMVISNNNPALDDFKKFYINGTAGFTEIKTYLLLLNVDTKKGWRLTEVTDIEEKFSIFLNCNSLWDKTNPNFDFSLREYPIKIKKGVEIE